MHVDLNADLGEDGGDDAAMLDHVSSINIACAWHAGSAVQMHALVSAAMQKGIAIGAHPGYADRENFGRKELQLPAPAIRSAILYQIGALEGIARAQGARLAHVKPHGALYNQAARDPELAACIARAIRDFDPGLKVMGLARSVLVDALRAEGLTALEEGFADRAYAADGQLVPRSKPGALIEDEGQMLSQVIGMVKHGRVRTRDGIDCPLRVDTICLHGDGAHALAFARSIRARLAQEGIAVAPPSPPGGR
jgi:UPF0271 protein